MPALKLTRTQWLICVIAALGFAFDIYELLMLPLIVGPARHELIGAAPGSPEFNGRIGKLFFIPAIAGGIFFAGLLTVGQFSFWGNYLPRVYPIHLRSTGESFAANIGTSYARITTTLATTTDIAAAPAKPAYTAAARKIGICRCGGKIEIKPGTTKCYSTRPECREKANVSATR